MESMSVELAQASTKVVQKASLTEETIQNWLIANLADVLDIKADEINIELPFERYGLDSSAAAGLLGMLEEWTGRELHPTIMYDYPTVESLARHLVESAV